MNLADYIAANKQRLILRWKRLAVEHLALALESSELIDHLPDFIDDVVAMLRDPSRRWPVLESARGHGRQRMRHGIDMGSLTEEMGLIIEVICELGQEDGRGLTCDEMRYLTRVVSRGTAASINAYAAMRDEELARQAGQHFSFVAHELRTPLQTARMAASLLSSVADGGEVKYLQRLDRSLSRLSDLVDNSLAQVRLSGRPELLVRRVDAREIVEDACEDVADHVEAKAQSLMAEVQPFSLDADRKLLESALTNLLKNAVKFTPEGGSICISARVEASRALFQVEDQCGGMPEELPARLFQPFVQAHADKSGFGLGLMIVKQAAEAHEGTVHVLNRPGHSCAFVVDVPLVQSTEPSNRVVPDVRE